ncbi:hypothetical protein H175_39p02 (plasmid) [Bacillus thuringiensis serovar thuringiensis str. IS5056]|uniref:hypothetical protein n=1 Tax=Bacillus thuringiensis TaxID=1428 RepID=UPI0002B76D40|nr:hypothetical protein [Bacillus thuringiensis]AGG04416.1 hypothetical protein H175_39p02 [Bacillus thuringiensis serovar thuringiensis str. IS5056]
MGLADRVLPEHIQRAGALESQLREYMKNQKMLEQQSNRGTASISEKNHAKKIRVKKSENISLFQDTYSVFFYTKNNTTQY